MKMKGIVTAAIVVFCALAGYMIIGDVTGDRQDKNPGRPLPSLSDGVLVYYFHGEVRCHTCRTIEAFSHHALEQAFAGALEDGSIEWHVINVEVPENEHFVETYQLFTSSLVIQKIRDGEPGDWKKLEKVWDLVGDENAFTRYVQSEIDTLMGTV